MSPDVTRSHISASAAEQQSHALRTTLTTLRLQTQLLLRLARRHDDPAWQRMAEGLAAIDAEISNLVRQLDHHHDP